MISLVIMLAFMDQRNSNGRFHFDQAALVSFDDPA